MAVQNLKRTGKFDQKKGVCVLACTLGFADITGDGSLVATLAANTVITRVTVLEDTTDTVNAGATFDLLAGATLIVDEGALDANNNATVIIVDLDIVKDIVIKAGATAPTTGTVKVLIEYIEYTKTTGEYTQS